MALLPDRFYFVQVSVAIKNLTPTLEGKGSSLPLQITQVRVKTWVYQIILGC